MPSRCVDDKGIGLKESATSFTNCSTDSSNLPVLLLLVVFCCTSASTTGTAYVCRGPWRAATGFDFWAHLRMVAQDKVT